MKRIFGILIALAFVLAASAAYAQAQTAPAAKPAPAAPTAPAAKTGTPFSSMPAMQTAPAAAPAPTAAKQAALDPKALATDICKKKGLVGTALETCVNEELAKKAEAAKIAPTPAAKPAEVKVGEMKPLAAPTETAKAPTAAPAVPAKPAETKPLVQPTK